MYSTAVIAVAGVLLLVGTILPGVRLWWPQHRDPVSRSDLGVALMTGALIAFAVLAVQLLIQIRSQRDANAREDQADHAALLLQLGSTSNLSDLDLQRQDLSSAYLKEKDLNGANLSQTSLAGASLQGSKLVGAILRGVSLDEAQLQRADLRYAALGGASLVEADLTGANLDAATLTPGVDLTKADLSNASARADLRGAVLTEANLVGAQMDRANLQGADFTGAEMQFADLRGADLRGANLRKAEDLELARDLSGATYDRDTRWPTTFYWPPLEATRPRCRKPVCTLPDSPAEALPKELTPLRDKLQRAAKDDACLPGWLVEEQQGKIEAHAPRRLASFSVSTRNLPDTSLRSWADESALESPKRIRSVTVAGSGGRIYALRAEDLVSSQPYKAVHVWFFRGRAEGFHAWAQARPETFSLFERDFIKLFAALGIGGHLFPWLRGGEHICRS
jgi:uncharacterized protein YjbI with pentapeptide repeats